MKLILEDDTIDRANRMLPWQTRTRLPNGKVLGHSEGKKRSGIEEIPDYRIVKLDEIIGLKNKSVLEFGCLEGSHTVGLLQYTDDVTAIDFRLANVIKTLAKISFFNKSAKVICRKAEDVSEKDGKFDVIFHCGVLYHLVDPVTHLRNLAKMTSCMLLDTHVVLGERAKKTHGYGCKKIGEAKGIFAGRYRYSIWLAYDELRRLCTELGFEINELEFRPHGKGKGKEKNGDRICWLLTK